MSVSSYSGNSYQLLSISEAHVDREAKIVNFLALYLEHAALDNDFLAIRLHAGQGKQLGLKYQSRLVQVQLDVIVLLATPFHVDWC